MMFLLQGAQMSRGMQRLRHFLLLLFRTLAVAGLIIGLGRPLAGGWLGGMGGGRPDTVFVLLDRSASMNELVHAGGATKLATGVSRIAEALENSEASRLVCVDSVSLEITELGEASDLLSLPLAQETAAIADLPAMLEVATEYLQRNQAGRAEIWICSDGQSSDWRPEDGRWKLLQEAIVAMPAGVRVNVLNFTESEGEDYSIRVERAERVTTRDANGVRTELVLDLRLRAAPEPIEEGASGSTPVSLPVAIDLGGARSIVQIELANGEGELKGHRMPLDKANGEGWGFVELPTDANAADNRFYFTFGTGDIQETLIVWEDSSVRDVLRFAAEAPSSESTEYIVRDHPITETGDLDLVGASLLLWQGALPQDADALAVEHFLERGGNVIFLPPAEGAQHVFEGCSWGSPVELEEGEESSSPTSWRSEDDLLRNGEDGTPLTVKELRVRQLTPAQGDLTRLAGFASGETLLSRAPTSRGGLYFLSTLPSPAFSNLAIQGVVLVAMVQRGLEAAALAQGSRGQQNAGNLDPLLSAAGYEMQSEVQEEWLLSEQLFHSGVIQSGENLIAINRALDEDRSRGLDEGSLAELMPEVEMSLVTGSAKETGLVEEIWRIFLMLMLLALLGEALLCITESSPALHAKKGAEA